MAEYACSACGKTFGSESQLREHEKTCKAAGCPQSGWHPAAVRHTREAPAKRAETLEAFPRGFFPGEAPERVETSLRAVTAPKGNRPSRPPSWRWSLFFRVMRERRRYD
jgi:DNA-directed RNA polymerase subunit RPC12/RpoP